ncbi:MAG: DUF1043 family protein [Pseudomonadota bacterium]
MVSSFAVVVIGIVSLAIGVGLGFWLARSGNELQAEKAAAAESALTDYQAKVSTHFEQTAEQFEQIGQQYRKLYGHFATSAQELLGDDAKLQQVFPPLLSAADAVADSEDATSTDELSGDASDSVAAATDEAEPTEAGDDTAPLSASDDATDEPVTDDTTSEAVAELSADDSDTDAAGGDADDVSAASDADDASDDETLAVTDDADTAVRVADEAANEETVSAAGDDTESDEDTAEVVALDDQPPRLNGAARTADTAHG